MASGESAARPAQQYLTFVLGGQSYGVDILCVQEIRGWSGVTKIPHSPVHVLGVMNLRGSIVPIIDLRMRFALERVEYTSITVVIVLSVRRDGHSRDFGVVVDGVSDVVDVEGSAVKAPPDMGAEVATQHIRGLVTLADRMITLLDLDQLVGSDLAGSNPDARAA